MTDTPDLSDKPPIRRFRHRFDATRLALDAAERQGRVARLAWESFGDRAAAIAFLNTHHEALGGRPIDLAVASDEGLAEVERVLAAAKLK